MEKQQKEDTVDWNEQYHAEEWRHGWELAQNKYLELAGSPERVDMRSYERQGGLMFFPPSTWEPPFLRWNARALKPISAISTEILKLPTV